MSSRDWQFLYFGGILYSGGRGRTLNVSVWEAFRASREEVSLVNSDFWCDWSECLA